MKLLLTIISIIFMMSCTSLKVTQPDYEHEFLMENNIVYVNGEVYAKLKSINYGMSDKKETYEAVFILEEYVDLSVSRDFISYISKLRPQWDVQIQNTHFYTLED